MISRETGTFLLRFSETNIEQSQKSDICGCLTLAFVEFDPETSELFLYITNFYVFYQIVFANI